MSEAPIPVPASFKDAAITAERYQALYDNVPHIFVSLNTDLSISDCNAAFCEKVGSPRESLVDQPFIRFVHPDERFLVESLLRDNVGEDKRTVEQTVTLIPSGDTNAMFLVEMTAVFLIRNEPDLAIILSMEDVTQKIQMEKEQKIARKQLYRSARLASIGTLASGVAHEINNPLTAILGFSSALLDRTRNHEHIPEEELNEYLSIINDETIRCRDIIENLSNFSRERDSNITAISLKESVSAALKLLYPRAHKNNCEIINNIEDDVRVYADSNRLGQVIINIISNSIDFSTGGCTVTLNVRESGRRKRFIGVTISDTGPGIDLHILPKVFDPFFTTKEVGKGIGLGLAMCHTIMEEFNGMIDIVSEKGRGTDVLLEIPLAPEG